MVLTTADCLWQDSSLMGVTTSGETLGPLTLFCCVSSESVMGNCMDRSSPGQAMELPDHNGLGYPTRPSVNEHHRPRTLQRHHTIQNSDDAYVCWPLLLLRSGILLVPTLPAVLWGHLCPSILPSQNPASLGTMQAWL